MGSLIRTDLSLFEERISEIDNSTPYSEVKEAIKVIKNEMHRDKELVCLCAPQVNKKLRLFTVKTAGNTFKTFLNPMIVNQSKETHLSLETNPSLENKTYIIPRRNEIHVAYQTPDGHIESESYKGVYAEIIQQMVEMLDGITLADYGLDLDDVGGYAKFKRATKKDKETVIQMYLDSLKQASIDLNMEIENDPVLKNINDTINFNAKMLNGEIKPVDEDGNIVEFTVPEEK